jgi:putative selenate reductase molybdopterin-binding subunit
VDIATPAQIMTAKALLDRNPSPSEAEIRLGMIGVLCRCTGYVRTVEAVQRASAMLRGEARPNSAIELTLPSNSSQVELPKPTIGIMAERSASLPRYFHPGYPVKQVVGKPEIKWMPRNWRGETSFYDDIHMEGMLYGALLTSLMLMPGSKRSILRKRALYPASMWC